MRRAMSKIISTSKFLNNQQGNSPGTAQGNGMDAASIGSQSVHQSVPSDSSIFNFSSNMKVDFSAVEDFYISLDDPHKSWLPGDEVSGQIILISKKNLANVEIMLSLIGYVRINASSHSKLRPVKHNLFNHTIKIYGGDDTSSQGSVSGSASGHSQPSPNSTNTYSSPESPPADDVSDVENDSYSNGLYKGEHRFPFVVKLPNKRIFTSIDFGKGSINYMLRTCIGNAGSHSLNHCGSAGSNQSHVGGVPDIPTSLFKKNQKLHNSCHSYEKVITLISPIDVTTLPPPKPKRLIIKDPRTHSNNVNNSPSLPSNSSQSSQSINGSRKLARIQSSTSTNTFNSISSNNSDNFDNFSSNSTPPNTTPNTGNGTPDHVAAGDQLTALKRPETIKVSLELPQRGFLRGELIPVKLSINHLKKIQDLNGIIVTFVRVCRLENGASGLYESFRKDLQQVIIPLYVDPVTFSSEINTSVRVPADSFPTIAGCPLVSFQYFVEVLVNLSGKSLSLDESEHANGRHPAHPKESDAVDASFFNYSPGMHQKERQGYVNTDKFKRSKKFLQLTTEVIIGTHRSEKIAPSTASVAGSTNSGTNFAGSGGNTLVPAATNGTDNGVSALSRRSSINSSPSITTHSPAPYSAGQPSLAVPVFSSELITPPYEQSSSSFAQPIVIEEAVISGVAPHYNEGFNQLSDKERMRAHEASLLPSAPPLEEEEEDIEEANGEVQAVRQEEEEEDVEAAAAVAEGEGESSTETQDVTQETAVDAPLVAPEVEVPTPSPAPAGAVPTEQFSFFAEHDEDDLYHEPVDLVPQYTR